ncbi:Enoyl-CoA hydratase AKT3-1 [Penicillium argentinense]|uniref:Enoyl-CoA hydratase AKT3-1 n=1 Tax=Penicillium argentinense TaxID=1131581 RepID=A0A9W9FH72_9EURO|nr:Enoyl-CoA hydratase AKT3-1 [Penicillium argentinense]KAJ5100086.1 Enoyl-CoA hydratase AKT3-1 [Penicillium argentinense]
MAPIPTIDLPASYESLSLTHIKISHSPIGSPTVTPVVVISLNRPENNNAFTPQMADSLTQAFHLFHIDPRIKAVVLTGAGKMFCAGSDLEIGFGDGGGRAVDFRDIGGRVALAIHRCHKPTIVALQGSAVGVGMTMTLPAAIRICHEKGKYGFVFTRRGLTIESCASYFLPRLVGFSRAMHLITTGGVYPPPCRNILAISLPRLSRRRPKFCRLAQDIAEYTSSLASSMSRALMWEGPSSPEEAHLLESRVFHHMVGQPDYKEGVGSFLEKRKPRFKADPRESCPPNFPWWTAANIFLEPSATKTSKL